MTSGRELCTFEVAGCLFGLDVRRVQEVLRTHTMTRVPLAPRAIRGLINLRGQIVLAIDLHYCLGLRQTLGDSCVMSVVLRSDDGPISLLVDVIRDVAEVNDVALALPDTLDENARSLIRGAYPRGERLLLELDVDRVLDRIHQ